jgi:hypothetical protein
VPSIEKLSLNSEDLDEEDENADEKMDFSHLKGRKPIQLFKFNLNSAKTFVSSQAESEFRETQSLLSK